MTKSRNELLLGTKWGVLESFSTRIIGVLFNLIVVWYISPDELGVLAIFTVLHAIISILQNFGIYDFLVFNKKRFNNLFPTCYFILILSCLFFFLFVILYKLFLFNNSEQEITFLFYLYALSLLPGALQSIPKANVYINKRFDIIYKIKTTVFLLNKVLTIIFLILGLSILSFGLSLLLTSLLSWICFQYYSNLKFKIKTTHLRYIFSQLKFTIGYTFSNALNNNIDFLVIGSISTKFLGLYYMSFSLSSQIVTLISKSIIPNIHAVFNDFKAGNHSKEITNFLITFSTIGFPLAFFQGFFSVPLINLFFPNKWIECIPHILILSVASGFKISTNLWIPLLKSLGKFKDVLKFSLFENFLFAIFLYGFIKFMGQYGASVAYFTVSIMIGLYALLSTLVKWDINPNQIIKNILMNFIIAIFAFSPSILFTFFSENNFYLTFSSLISLLMYVAYFFFFRNKKYQLIKKMILKN